MQSHNINGKTVFIKIKPFEGKKSQEYYENQIYSALSIIGLDKNHVKINYVEDAVKVSWTINSKLFSFFCTSQSNKILNLGAIAQAITEDIRQITRGIKTLDLVMKQYEDQIDLESNDINSNYKDKKFPTNLLNLENENTEEFDINVLKIDSEVNEELDKKYRYLLKEPNEKLDIIYLKFKEECIRANTPNHPLFKALKIVRQKRGLKL